jgi:mono/diheme cytochrome c family protein
MSLLAIAGLAVLTSSVSASGDDKVDFKQIRPLLSDKCFACHGPNEDGREGGFRLDEKDSAMGEADSGEHPIVPGDPDASELYARLIEHDPDMRMPPADTNKSLTDEEIALIKQWIEQGAEWQGHWAFESPQRPTPPTAKQHESWVSNDIDRFTLARMEEAGLQPSAEASKRTLIRRVTFDLTGLPPTPAEVDAFLADESPDAYATLIDRLLESPRYGEHMARYWLDAARYGDTHGLHLDNYREIWPYRDWVIQAFNNNMPFDQFTIEQLAGDLLPDATLEQQIATGFNRCHVTTNEGGVIKEEVYVRNVIDRVVTTGTVFMGLTLDCTRCHNHKYDPFTMEDFYSLFAYFNSLDGGAMDGNRKDPAPIIRVLTDEQQTQIAEAQQKLDDLNERVRSALAAIQYEEPEGDKNGKVTETEEYVWLDDDLPAGAKAEGDWKFATAPDPVFSGEKASTRTATGLSQHFFQGAKEPLVVAEGQTLFAYIYLDPENPPKEIMMQWNDGSWEHRAYWGENKIDWGKDGQVGRKHLGELPEVEKWVRLEVTVEQVGLKPGAKINGWAFTQFDGKVYWDKAGVVTEKTAYASLKTWDSDQRTAGAASLPKPIQDIVKMEPEKRKEGQIRKLREYFLENVYSAARDTFAPLQAEIKQTKDRIAAIERSAPTTLVFKERKEPRKSFVLHRGEYDQQRDEVGRSVPALFPPLPEGASNDRLGLAKWLVDPKHPLTARVTMNRFWQQVFGVGLVKTADDFGSQGEVPSHPDLLDWLAVQFIDDGWDVKKSMKRILMSATYRQTSHAEPELYQRDPENRLLARGPRFRLSAEMLRDQALYVSGLLVEEIGGPGVKPPQPDGLWFAVGYSGSNTVRFKEDTGENKVHRRTVYTFIKRTAPPPQMSTFDAPSRETCSVRRERTNTPLQALLLMNDPQYVECARALAERAICEGGDSVESRAEFIFQTCTGRVPAPEELAVLVETYGQHLKTYDADPEAAKQLAAVGIAKLKEELSVNELAAWTMIGNLVMNLDEVISKN